jgi:sterol desaturase/sphingolipid hydroxylase (fatty acid hydroxylase superfamily)
MAITIQTQRKVLKEALINKLKRSTTRFLGMYYLCISLVLVYLASMYSTLNFIENVAFFTAGLISWSLIEYLLHRFVFHINKYFPFMQKVHRLFHGHHHEDPRDHARLFMPPVAGAIAVILTLCFFFLFMRYSAFAFVAGISAGYLAYCTIHYLVHTRPSKLPFHRLWIHHLKHHHKYPDKAYGVSSPLWDIIFGTMPPENGNTTKHFS